MFRSCGPKDVLRQGACASGIVGSIPSLPREQEKRLQPVKGRHQLVDTLVLQS